MTLRNLLVTSVLLAVLAPAFAPAAGAATLDTIRKSGVIRLGYIDGAAPFSYADASGEPQGYSVDLCRAVAEGIGAQLKRPDLKVRWVRLTVQNRIEAVQKKQVDVECSTATWTLGRQRLVDFSLVTFVDGGNVLMRIDAQARRVADFGGKKIGVIGGTTTESALREVLKRTQTDAEVVLVKTRDEGLAALRESKVDGFASDRTTLIGVAVTRAAGDAFKLMEEDFSLEQYALILPRNDADFRLAVNRTLAQLFRTGDIRRVYDRWLGPLGPPSVLLSATYFIQSIAE